MNFIMSDTKTNNSFKSYIGLHDTNLSAHDVSNDESFSEILLPKLLPGEMVVAEAHSVLLFTPVSDKKNGKLGVLVVTNFKLSFITAEEEQNTYYISYQRNMLLGPNDVSLSNVDVLYQISSKKRKLTPGSSVSDQVKGIFVLCKDMRALTFSFKLSPPGHGRKLTNALLHHGFPKQHHLLFPFEYTVPYYPGNHQVTMFRTAVDWEKELTRTASVGWRISTVNQNFRLSESSPQWLVVCSSILDKQLREAAPHFNGGRLPQWCWSSHSGAALVRMADVVSACDRIKDRKSLHYKVRMQENILLETVRKSHPRLTQPVVIELTKDMPSLRHIQVSFCKLRDLCVADNEKHFWEQDSQFYSSLESTRWLHYVGNCLLKAVNAASNLAKDITVVLQESDGRDISCVIASLTQIIMDPYFRTINGFQSLVQKEWVSMGHPFCIRLGHIYKSNTQQSPIWLLFLDCVWQLLQQYPLEFEFNQIYLTTLWDSSLIPIFETFIFDSEKERSEASSVSPVILRSVWDFGEQLPERDIASFSNPLYRESPKHLEVKSGVPCLHLWSQCYFRFLPILEIKGGGKPQVDLAIRELLLPPGSSVMSVESKQQIGSFYPFTHWNTRNSVNQNSLLLSTLSLNTTDDSQSIISFSCD
nr:PREDICTED: myotubularin-related protein 10-B [Bemisia tabaci]